MLELNDCLVATIQHGNAGPHASRVDVRDDQSTNAALPQQAIRDATYATYPDALHTGSQGFQNLGLALNYGWNPELVTTTYALSLLTGILAVLIGMRMFGRRDLHG